MLLEAARLSMSFPGVRALDQVDFSVRSGEVHALVGENGAGKSTLIRILCGEIADYDGRLTLDGRVVRFASPRDALSAGIAVIPQELLLVNSLTAAENVCLGHEPRSRWGLIDRRAVAERAGAVLASLDGADIAPFPVGTLDIGRRQLVTIARALSLQARVIVMDEPTAALGSVDVDRLECLVRQLAEEGAAIVYVSHRLDEVLRLANRITVLRDGRRIAALEARHATEPGLIRLMVGRDIDRPTLAPVPQEAEELLSVDRLSVRDPERVGGYRLRNVSLNVRRGEIVGLAGLIGAGRSDLLLALVGALEQPVDGHVRVAGRTYIPRDPVDARRAGLALLPEDRAIQGIMPHQSVLSNITIGSLERVSRGGWIDRALESASGADLIARTGMRVASPGAPITTLSGGNQQKALLARCLFASPSLLLLDEPTHGIDLAAKTDIYRLISDLAQRGFGIVVCSSELPEILALCHRVVVFRKGESVATFDHSEATEERILAAASPGAPQARPPERSGAWGPRERRRGGSAGAKPPGSYLRYASLAGLVAVAILAVVFSPIRGGRIVFLDLGNLTDILRQIAEKGILAAGMTPVIISGGIDLSVGAVLALSATLSALLLMHGGYGIVASCTVALVIGALIGLLNGTISAKWRIQPFIVTLATMSAARGIARYISGGAAVPLSFGSGAAPEGFRALAGSIAPYVPVPAVIFLAAMGAIHLLLSRTRSGRYIYAIGDNEAAARLSGVPIAGQKAAVYVVCAMLAAAAGLIHCAQLEQGNPNDGIAYELDAIAAVVIGGTSLSGGVGTAGGTLVGTLIIGIINNSMGLNNIDANVQLILKGAVILGAVWLQGRRR
jgi:ABC-type sugar transport system ATPase subunit/ribose/xylose/arabinose/galactoside ABC-type transport system permease subunit